MARHVSHASFSSLRILTCALTQVFTKKNAELHRRGRSAQTAFLIHIVAFVGSRGFNPPAGAQVSHLCDCRTCFNPDHLVPESPQLNNSRKGCAGPVFCQYHGHLLVDLCPHTPKCIRPPREDTFCCLAVRESSPGWRTASQASQRSQQSAGRSTPTGSAVSQQPSPITASTQNGVRPSALLQSWASQESEEFDGAEELEMAVAAGEL
jgi:hypothetical protein